MTTTKTLTYFGDPVDEGAVKQIKTCLEDDRAVAGALMADHHLGYSMPIGGVVVYDGAISPSGVGFDIACGNKAVQTNILYDDVREYKVVLMQEIQKRLSFGIGRSNPEPVDHPLFDSPVWDELDTAPGQPLKQKAAAQLGTVGSGNHYVDLLYDEDGFVWVANHFGSRGFGHTVATWFLAVAAGKGLGDRVPETDEPAVLDIGTWGGDLYVEAMRLAGEYAYAGRDFVMDQVLDILGAEPLVSVHNHHNFAWEENGQWVVRKGATPLTRDPAFIGGSMGDVSVIVKGKPIPEGHAIGDKTAVLDIGALGSAPHGAGRTMSRTKAAGKWKKINEERTKPNGTTYSFKRRVRQGGVIDWPTVKKDLLSKGIVVLGSGPDEAPGVYKNLRDVLACHDNIEVLYELHPFGVVMAGEDTFDPYKD